MSRSCGTCSACCRWPSVAQLDKPAKTPCHNLRKCGHGCTIYPTRPSACNYACSWLRGAGEKLDQPGRCGVLVDVRVTQFGEVLVAHQLRPGAAASKLGRKAIRRIARDRKLPCLVAGYDDVEVVVGVLGSGDFVREVESKGPGIRLGGQKDWVQNIIAAAMKGKIYPGLSHGG